MKKHLKIYNKNSQFIDEELQASRMFQSNLI